jgi:hypothetical protein
MPTLKNERRNNLPLHLKRTRARHRWLMPVILGTQEAEIRRIKVQSHPRQTVCETLSQKTLHKNRAGRVAQGEGPEFNSQYCKRERERERESAPEPQRQLEKARKRNPKLVEERKRLDQK